MRSLETGMKIPSDHQTWQLNISYTVNEGVKGEIIDLNAGFSIAMIPAGWIIFRSFSDPIFLVFGHIFPWPIFFSSLMAHPEIWVRDQGQIQR